MVDVVGQELERKALEGGLDCAHLSQDVDAVAVGLDHPLDPADLPFDAVQALGQCHFVVAMVVVHPRILPSGGITARGSRIKCANVIAITLVVIVKTRTRMLRRSATHARSVS